MFFLRSMIESVPFGLNRPMSPVANHPFSSTSAVACSSKTRPCSEHKIQSDAPHLLVLVVTSENIGSTNLRKNTNMSGLNSAAIGYQNFSTSVRLVVGEI